jgi:large conductance mechanosensitive channel
MSVVGEFKQFAMRGNVIDLAVGVIIGAAFGKIVSSLVGDIVMPVVAASGEDPAVLLSYGKFVQAAVDFLIIALAIFLVVKGINNLKRKEEAKPAAPPPLPEPSAEQKLLAEIRDLLKNR